MTILILSDTSFRSTCTDNVLFFLQKISDVGWLHIFKLQTNHFKQFHSYKDGITAELHTTRLCEYSDFAKNQ